MKKGLILQGGAMRGLYTAGVLDVLYEQGVKVDLVAGVSAGAIHACNYMSGQTGRSIRYFSKYCTDKRFMSVESLLRTGDLFGVEFGYHEIPEKLDPFDEAAFEANPAEFYAVTTNVETGNAIYHRCRTMKGNDLDYLRASASMPLASRFVEVDGKKLLDGGITDNVPLAWAQGQGCAKNIVVLTQCRGYRKQQDNTDLLFRAVYGRSYPQLARCMHERAEHYNVQMNYIDAAADAGACFALYPSEDLGISRTEKDPKKLRAQYALGRRDAYKNLGALKAYLQR